MTHPVINNGKIYSITTEEERACLSRLAKRVPDNGCILEIGCLYGGITSILALSAPNAYVTTIDDFSWTPDGFPKSSKQLAENNFAELEIDNIKVIEEDSRKIGRKWDKEIDLLWIDGGHSFSFVYSDLYLFGTHARVIALHDYNNPIWSSIRQAVETFISKFPYWYVDEVVGMVCVLRRRE